MVGAHGPALGGSAWLSRALKAERSLAFAPPSLAAMRVSNTGQSSGDLSSGLGSSGRHHLETLDLSVLKQNCRQLTFARPVLESCFQSRYQTRLWKDERAFQAVDALLRDRRDQEPTGFVIRQGDLGLQRIRFWLHSSERVV